MARVKEGDRIELIYTDDPNTKLRSGDQGTVVGLGLGEISGGKNQIHVDWDSGSTLSLIDGVDRYKIVSNPCKTEGKKFSNMKKLALWKDRLQSVYKDLEEFKRFDKIYGLVGRLGYENVEKAWEDNPLIQGFEQPEDFKVVKSQLEGEYEFMEDYKGIEFAINWKDREPTKEEFELIRKQFINEGYIEDEGFMMFSLDVYFDQEYEVAQDACPVYIDFIDFAMKFYGHVVNGELEIIKTPTGYAAVELYH